MKQNIKLEIEDGKPVMVSITYDTPPTKMPTEYQKHVAEIHDDELRDLMDDYD